MVELGVGVWLGVGMGLLVRSLLSGLRGAGTGTLGWAELEAGWLDDDSGPSLSAQARSGRVLWVSL